jgi:hypothetical protein
MSELNKRLLTLLMGEVEKVCQEEGISYFAQFQIGDQEIYEYTSGHVLLDTATIITQLQLLEAKKGIKL